MKNGHTWRATKLVAWAVFIAWFSQAIYLVAPLLDQSVAKTASATQGVINQYPFIFSRMKSDGYFEELETPDEVERNVAQTLWVGWIVQTGVILLGLGAAVLAFYNVRYWRLAIVSTSALYLWGWWLSQEALVFAPISVGKALELKWELSKVLGVPTFFHQEIVLPLLYLVVVAFVILKWKQV